MVQTTIRFPEKLYKKLKKEAKSRGMSLNAFVISMLWDERKSNVKHSQTNHQITYLQQMKQVQKKGGSR